MDSMENIYVILSATPTFMGKVIRIITRSSFNHSSISLSENWDEMYSFARYRAHNPLVGGFVKEFPQRLSLGKDRTVIIKVYKIPISENQFNKIRKFIYSIKEDKEENIYNSMGALGTLFRCKFNIYKTYTCSNFVVKSLIAGEIKLGNQESKNIVPDEMQKSLDKYTCYNGCLNDYKPIKGVTFNTKDFFVRTNFITEIARTFHHFYKLIKRAI